MTEPPTPDPESLRLARWNRPLKLATAASWSLGTMVALVCWWLARRG